MRCEEHGSAEGSSINSSSAGDIKLPALNTYPRAIYEVRMLALRLPREVM